MLRAQESSRQCIADTAELLAERGHYGTISVVRRDYRRRIRYALCFCDCVTLHLTASIHFHHNRSIVRGVVSELVDREDLPVEIQYRKEERA
jgi:hypothetical protein